MFREIRNLNFPTNKTSGIKNIIPNGKCTVISAPVLKTIIIPDHETALISSHITAVIPDPDRESRYPVKPGMTSQHNPQDNDTLKSTYQENAISKATRN